MMQPKAVLFDFDGVVVNSFEVHFKAWADAFFKLFGKNLETFPEGLEGKSPIEISKRLSQFGGDEGKSDELYTLKGDLLHSGTKPPNLLPGVKELTELLKSKNIPYGIASNATRQFIENSIKQLAIDFDIFLGVENYQFPKPNPEPYIMLAKKLGVSTLDFKDVVVFEDSITGVTAAIKAGMIAVGIETQHTAEQLLDVGCAHSYSNLLTAQSLFKRL